MSEWDPGWDEYLDTKLNAFKKSKGLWFQGGNYKNMLC